MAVQDGDPSPACGKGVHGFLWEEGIRELADWSLNVGWLIPRLPAHNVVDRNGK
ncbi:MAG TPA: hypothetical protein VFQ91_15430 [Bryobacteraceae bacterium]|nr:hypothetical protein [Bryobacteraceae bacterium]